MANQAPLGGLCPLSTGAPNHIEITSDEDDNAPHVQRTTPPDLAYPRARAAEPPRLAVTGPKPSADQRKAWAMGTCALDDVPSSTTASIAS